MIWSYKYFVSIVSVLFLGLASYATIGLVLNSWTLEKGQFHGTWPMNERCGIVVLMITQALFLIVTVIGFAGVACRSVVVWCIPGFILLGTGVALLVFGIATLREASRDLTFDIFRQLLKAKGTKSEENLRWLSAAQWERDCCGVISYKDYIQFNYTSLTSGSVPDTCCDRTFKIPRTNCGAGILVPGKPVLEVETILMTNGCGPILSRIQRLSLKKLGMEMLLMGLVALTMTALIYVGIFKIVATEYAQLDEAEESNDENTRGDTSQTAVSSTTVANTCANSHNTASIARNSTNRRIFRTRRHGGGESIVSFAVDLENNNIRQTGAAPTRARTAFLGNRTAAVRKVQGRVKNRNHAGNLNKVKGLIRKTHNQRPRSAAPKVHPGYLKCSTETLEMLMKPRDNNSILSTTPYPSTHNFMSYFRQTQEPGSKVTDSDPNMQRPFVLPPLSHYSSLPQVRTPLTSTVGLKNDVQARAILEFKQRLLPRGTSVQPPRRSTSPPPIPPVTSQTQHLHYYKISPPTQPPQTTVSPIPSSVMTQAPTFLDLKFPSRIAESTLATIQEEGESAASTVIPAPQPDQRVSIFEVFEELVSQEEEDASGGDNTVAPIEEVSPSNQPCLDEMPAPSSGMVVKEDTEGLEDLEPDMNLPNFKIEADTIDALVYFQL